MESLQQFKERINLFQVRSVPPERIFGLPSNLSEKVTPGTGELKPFYGNTIAYFLDKPALDLIDRITDLLYDKLAEGLAERLPLDMAHLTLHDLHASVTLDAVEALISTNASRVSELVEKAREVGTIKMVCTTVFNLMNTSVVIGLSAATEHDHHKLMQARSLFDEIVPSGTFTPHITVAYYRPEAPVPLNPETLAATLEQLTLVLADFELELRPEHLYELKFDSMANYWALDQ